MASDIFNANRFPPAVAFGTGRILLVDENSADLRFYSLLLASQSYHVVPCSSFDDAAQQLEQATFDFIMVDQGTAAFEGRKILERAIQQNRHRAVLVTTQALDTHCYLEAMHLGAVDYLEKPLAPRHLVRLVRGHIGGPRARMQGAV